MATPHHIPIKAAARKLPIKRKTPDSPSYPNPNLRPSSSVSSSSDEDSKAPPPFKFHRIWPESDELRFLQALLDAAAEGLSFPRDLSPFFDRFSLSMPQPYTKSQLSEKLRRLRKKFRVLSARLSRGLDASLLTPHDRALLHLSKQLWHPAFAASSPFTTPIKKKPPPSPPPQSPLVKTPSPAPSNLNSNGGRSDSNGGDLSSALGRQEDPLGLPAGSGGIGRDTARTVMDVFEQSLNEVRMVLLQRGLLYPDHVMMGSGSGRGRAADLAKRWREQRVAELDVLARRLMLVLEHAISK